MEEVENLPPDCIARPQWRNCDAGPEMGGFFWDGGSALLVRSGSALPAAET
jgi:hypothetical protein